MRRFFGKLWEGIVCASRYLWLPGALAVILGLIILWIWCGPLDAFTDFCNNAANSVMESVNHMFTFGWGMAVLDWTQEMANDSFFFAFFLALPFLLFSIALFVIQFAIAIIWAVLALVISFLIMLFYFIVGILIVYVIGPAACIAAIVFTIMKRARADGEFSSTMETVGCVISVVLCVAFAILFCYGAYVPMAQ